MIVGGEHVVPPSGGVAEEPAEAGTANPNWIGPLKLLQCIGEGGMGSAWMAEQIEPVRRRVDVKVVQPGMGSSQMPAAG